MCTKRRVTEMRCLKMPQSLSWQGIRSGLWVGKRLFSACLANSLECVHCGDMEESIANAFFDCQVLRLLCKLLEDDMVRLLNGKFFVQEAGTVCNNLTSSLNRTKGDEFLYLLVIMRVVIWKTRVFLVSDAGGLLKTSNKNWNSVWERKTLFFGVR